MRRIRAVTGPLVLGALLATTPQLAFGQGEEFLVALNTTGVPPGTEIRGDQLGEFIAKYLSVKVGTDMRPLSVRLGVELISRDAGVIGKYESQAVKVEGGETYSGSTWVSQRDRHEAMGFGFRGKIAIGRVVVVNHEEQYVPRECKAATHAVRITLVSDGRSIITDFLNICLRVEN